MEVLYGKSSRNRKQRQSKGRRCVVADATEIGQRHGVFTLRVGEPATAPVCLVFPAEIAAILVQHMDEARIDAEEEYWTVVPPRVKAMNTADPDAVSQGISRWLLSLNWERVARAATGGQAFLVSYAGHVGLCTEPPFTDEFLIAIFDPLQLQRLSPALKQAAATAVSESRRIGPTTLARLNEVRRFVKAQSWPAISVPEVSTAQAEATITHAYRGFLAREPYIRPARRDVQPRTG
ncbi:hypothetical protein [Nonomuraea insulae]|uniref:Uncharacterized protein n=1 Tax=Nonomuraea insulae TaxID=1616787 RepID=A0ABW1CTS2_9ACTN